MIVKFNVLLNILTVDVKTKLRENIYIKEIGKKNNEVFLRIYIYIYRNIEV